MAVFKGLKFQTQLEDSGEKFCVEMLPGTQMTPVLTGKDLVLEGSTTKIEDKQVPGKCGNPSGSHVSGRFEWESLDPRHALVMNCGTWQLGQLKLWICVSFFMGI